MTSDLEAAFDYYWRTLDGPDLEPEYRFGAVAAGGTGRGVRKRLAEAGLQDWRFDRAAPDVRVAVELDGGTWVNGRHNRPSGFSDDCQKFNAAAALGWLVFRFTGDMLAEDAAGCLEPVIGTIEARRLQAAWLVDVSTPTHDDPGGQQDADDDEE